MASLPPHARVALRLSIAVATALHLISTAAFAQRVVPGTFELSGFTSLATNRQTISLGTPGGPLDATNLDVTSIHFGFEGTYYISRRVGVGVLASNQRLSADAPDRDARTTVASTYVGPLVQIRVPLGGRSTFAIIGSYGGTTVTVRNLNTGVGTPQDLHANGKYWLAGGGLSLGLSSRTSFDFGVSYQSSTFSGAPGSARTKSAGLLTNAAVSIYLGK